MDLLAWDKKLNKPRPRIDRFIPPRESLPDLQRRLLWSVKTYRTDKWGKKYYQREKYSKYLNDAFGLEEKNPSDEHTLRAWPCAPRKKTFLSSADSVLDLPTYSRATFPELLDWSKEDCLVAALGSSYYTWSWRSQSLISQGFANSKINVCKYDPKGEILALGTASNIVELHNCALTKCVAYCQCRCMKENKHCSITALEWSPTGNSFVTGCTSGVVVSYTYNMKTTISMLNVTSSIILTIRISPDARLVAVTSLDLFKVDILTWPSLERYQDLHFHLKPQTISWHPWRTALLGVGGNSTTLNAHVGIVDIRKRGFIEQKLNRSKYMLDMMLFSRRTGELVVSVSKLVYSELLVLNGRYSVVDHWGEGRRELDRVRTMIFSPDGSKLATATTSEDLIIWNFLPEDRKDNKVTQSRKFSAIPEYIDVVFNGVSLR